ncbi:hypothetical protein ACVXZ4_10025 [Lacisediminihabitans sp. FW035]
MELTGREEGIWNVITRDSIHQFNFTDRTVRRIPGPTARPGINDVARTLRQLTECRVNQRGYWTMRSDRFDVDLYWQVTSVISRIERADHPLPAPPAGPGEEGEG